MGFWFVNFGEAVEYGRYLHLGASEDAWGK